MIQDWRYETFLRSYWWANYALNQCVYFSGSTFHVVISISNVGFTSWYAIRCFLIWRLLPSTRDPPVWIDLFAGQRYVLWIELFNTGVNTDPSPPNANPTWGIWVLVIHQKPANWKPKPSEFWSVRIPNSEGLGEPAIFHVGFGFGGEKPLKPFVKWSFVYLCS